MDIRIVSSLTADDENELAPTVLETIVSLLEALPVAYAVQINTTDTVLRHTNVTGINPDSSLDHAAPARTRNS